MENAVQRWNEIMDVRAQQMDAAYARLGRTSADFWDRRAHGYHRSTQETVASDPLFLKLQNVTSSQTTVIDVGAGTGRFTLALAPQAKHILAVEPSAAMLQYLHQDATEKGLTNLSFVPTTWQDAPSNLSADIVICSHVLYPIRDIESFLTKLFSATRGNCYIYMRANHIDAVTGHLWQHFHGDERCLPPGYIHALDVLFEMDIYANVEVVRLTSSLRFPSLEVAVDELIEQLILSPDEETRGELRKLLQE